MESRSNVRRRRVRILRLTARLWSITSLTLMLGFLVGEGVAPKTTVEWPTTVEWLGFLFFPLGISAGMILSWWRERAGALVTVGSLFAFYAINLTASGTLPKGWAWPAFAAPGFLFFFCSFEPSRLLSHATHDRHSRKSR